MLILLPKLGNSDKLGNKSASEYTTNDRFAVLEGRITTPQAEESTLNASITFDYPEGFNANNCIVIGLMSRNTASTSLFGSTVGSTKTSAEVVRANYGLQAVFQKNNFYVTVYKVDTSESSKTIAIRVVLMKLPTYEEGVDYTLGDVNGDGQISKTDADLVNNFYVGNIGLTAKQLKAGDVNKDGKVNSADAVQILKYEAGEITKFN